MVAGHEARMTTRSAPSQAGETVTSSRWLTVSEAARHIGCSRDTVHGWIAKGRLPAVQIAGRRWVLPEDLRAAQQAVHLGRVIPDWHQHPTVPGSACASYARR